MLISCGDASSPSNIAKKYIEATKNYDFKAAKEYIAKEYEAEMDRIDEQMNTPEVQATVAAIRAAVKTPITRKVIDEKISKDGNSAIVTIRIEGQGESYEEYLLMILEDGVWKVNENPSAWK